MSTNGKSNGATPGNENENVIVGNFGGIDNGTATVSGANALKRRPKKVLTPFAYAAGLYREAGWEGTLPLPVREKASPPNGYTGKNGAFPSAEIVEEWTANGYPNGSGPVKAGNIAIRLPRGVIGIDIDHYGDKHGADHIAELEKELGPLPPTYRSSARGAGDPSGIRLYRVDPEVEYVGSVSGMDIDIIQYHHRYMVVYPSLHPSGERYRWFLADGSEVEDFPDVEALPDLPAKWRERLMSGPVTEGAEHADASEVEAFLTAYAGDTHPHLYKGLIEGLESGAAGSRHDAMCAALRRAMEEARAGFYPASEAVEAIRAAFKQAVRGEKHRDVRGEFSRALSWAVGAARAKTETEIEEIRSNLLAKLEAAEDDGEGDRSRDGRLRVNVSSKATAGEWLRKELGRRELSGIFFRKGQLVHTPLVGEEGYIAPQQDDNSDVTNEDGPAQVAILNAAQLKAKVEVRYFIGKRRETTTEDGQKKRLWNRELFPNESAQHAYNAACCGDDVPNLRILHGVTHTPIMRPDGSVLDQPGYDLSTKFLYLPDSGVINSRRVSERPTAREIAEAREALSLPVSEFPFVEEYHLANWMGVLFTPIMRTILPPPYQMEIIDAPSPGSGKSYLANMQRAIHGGVIRGDFPEDNAELSKSITAILTGTTSPLVQFDNVRGSVKSSVLEKLLSSAEWNDRWLGHSKEISAANDRVWIVTANNAVISGDLARRSLWVTIDPKIPHPEMRTGFKIKNPPEYMRKNRALILWAMLTIARGWINDGAVRATDVRSDDYTEWVAGLRGMLGWAGFPGEFAHVEKERIVESAEDVEWGEFLADVYGAFGEEWFFVSDLHRMIGNIGEPGVDGADTKIHSSSLPGDLAHKFVPYYENRAGGFAKSLGWWFKNRTGRWSAGMSVLGEQDTSKKKMKYRIVQTSR